MKKDKKKETKLTAKELQVAILKLFKANPDKRYSTRHIIEKLKIGNNRDSVQHALDQLEATGQLKNVAKKAADKAAGKTEIAKPIFQNQQPKRPSRLKVGISQPTEPA